MIKKIIVELADQEATFQEFDSIQSFVESDLFKTDHGTEAEVVETPVVPEVAPEPVVEAAPETPANPAE